MHGRPASGGGLVWAIASRAAASWRRWTSPAAGSASTAWPRWARGTARSTWPPTRASSPGPAGPARQDRKSTRLNSSHLGISYAVFCLKKKKTKENTIYDDITSKGIPTAPRHALLPQHTPSVALTTNNSLHHAIQTSDDVLSPSAHVVP